MTETTDRKGENCLYFDDTCSWCRRSIRWIEPILRRRGVMTAPFANGAAEPEMRLTWHDGRAFGGADAALFLAGRIWWAWPLSALSRIPAVRAVLTTAYRRLAANRPCANGRCEWTRRPFRPPLAAGWVATGLFTSAAAFLGNALPGMSPVGRMWLLAGSLWLGFKVIAWTREPAPVSPRFALWVGMDAAAFAVPHPPLPQRPVRDRDGFLGLGAGSLCFLAALATHPGGALSGALTMAGLIATLHFGLFHLMAGAWQRRGIPVTPLMRAPWRATTLAELWGARWNRAFSDIARIAVFRPLVRRCGVAWGTLGGFLASGLAHEIVISLPAGAGYGLPTAYFLLQGVAVLVQRRFPRLGRGFTWLLFLGPSPLLFHPPFLKMLTPTW